MSADIVRKLKKALPKKRRKILRRMWQKNQDFFARTKGCQDFAELLKSRDLADYEIKINEEFLDIVEAKTGLFCHPPGDLLGQVERLAGPYHGDWVTVVEPLHANFGEGSHGDIVRGFIEGLYRGCDEIRTRRLRDKLDLPPGEDGKRHCGPVVFMGIFHGLHILSFLEKVSPTHIILVEPDVESFLLSCYFVDYEFLGKKFVTLSLNVGGEVSDVLVDNFFDTVSISSRVWVRFLPVYRDERFEKIIEQVKLRWAKFEVHVPYGNELKGLLAGEKNLKKHHRYCSARPLSVSYENVAVVGSGPSLKNDLDWLRENRENLLVVTATSAGLLLSDNDIMPDVQTFVEVDDKPLMRKFLLPCPTVIYYKSNPDFMGRLDEPILYAEGGWCNSVHFTSPLWHTDPTSANLAMRVACLFRPKNIFLVGMDLSVRGASGEYHANESIGKTLSYVSGHFARRSMLVEKTNFPESQGVLSSNSYFWFAKKSLEECIQSSGGGATVYNLSDGIRIEGAQPLKSKDVSLSSAKRPSAREILDLFPQITPADYQPYQRKGQDLLAQMKDEILGFFENDFNWDKFARTLDVAVVFTLEKYCDPAENDFRMGVYYPLVCDVVTEWYRAMIYAESREEAEMLYANGREALRAVFRELEWPSELDAV